MGADDAGERHSLTAVDVLRRRLGEVDATTHPFPPARLVQIADDLVRVVTSESARWERRT